MSEETAAPNGLERHIQSGLAILVIALVIWVGNSVTGLEKSNVELKVQSTNMQDDIRDLKLDIRDAVTSNYTRQDAARDITVYEDKLKGVESRVLHLEKEFDVILVNQPSLFKKTHD